MQSNTFIFIIIALLLSLSIAYYQYFHKSKDVKKRKVLLFTLRSFSLFFLFLVFINPSIKTTEVENMKPILSVLVDNSASTKFFNQEENVQKTLASLENSNNLNSKFEVRFFSFGEDLKVKDSLHFADVNTNISKALKTINELYPYKNNATLLLSDGNQTTGNDYEYFMYCGY